MTGIALHTNEIFQYLVLDKIVIAFTAKNTSFSLCYFNVDFSNEYAYLKCVAKLFLFKYMFMQLHNTLL